jgi:hypothetical protein
MLDGSLHTYTLPSYLHPASTIQVLDVSTTVDSAIAMEALVPTEARGQPAVLALEALAVCPQDVLEANRCVPFCYWKKQGQLIK